MRLHARFMREMRDYYEKTASAYRRRCRRQGIKPKHKLKRLRSPERPRHKVSVNILSFFNQEMYYL